MESIFFFFSIYFLQLFRLWHIFLILLCLLGHNNKNKNLIITRRTKYNNSYLYPNKYLI